MGHLSTLIGKIAEQLPQPERSFIGPEHLAANQSPPRVVWIPARDRYGPPEGPGQNPRPLRTRFAGCEVHVWGENYEATEDLLNLVQAAIHRVAVGCYQIEGESGWLDRGGSLTSKGRVYLFNVVFKIPVTDAPVTTGQVTSIPQTPVLVVGAPPADSPG